MLVQPTPGCVSWEAITRPLQACFLLSSERMRQIIFTVLLLWCSVLGSDGFPSKRYLLHAKVQCSKKIGHGVEHRWSGISVQPKQAHTASHHWGNTWQLRNRVQQGYLVHTSVILTTLLHSDDLGPVSFSWCTFLRAGSVLLISWLLVPSLVPGKEKALCLC